MPQKLPPCRHPAHPVNPVGNRPEQLRIFNSGQERKPSGTAPLQGELRGGAGFTLLKGLRPIALSPASNLTPRLIDVGKHPHHLVRGSGIGEGKGSAPAWSAADHRGVKLDFLEMV